MFTLKETLHNATQFLLNKTESAHLDAEVLLAHVLNQSRSYLYAFPEKKLSANIIDTYQNLIARRKNGEPVAYLIGVKEFWSLNLMVTNATLIPRPETESLIEFVLKHFKKETAIKIADLGTGSGAIAIALAHERKDWFIHATDISCDALQIASKNAQHLALNHITFLHGNWCTALMHFDYDLIISNPPYIAASEWPQYQSGLAFEPYQALVALDEGFHDIEMICNTSKNHLKANGLLIIEHGCDQGSRVREIFSRAEFSQIKTYLDLDQHERFTVGFK